MDQTAIGGMRLPVEGTYNLRSAGGYPVEGGAVREGSLFRSDALHGLGEEGRAWFTAQQISRVIDLRDPEEAASRPNALDGVAVETVSHPIMQEGGHPEMPTGFDLNEVYRRIIEKSADRVAGAVRLIADAPEGGVLVHCSAGKDRTGVVIASTLTAIGVPRDQIVADYTASAANLSGEWADQMTPVFVGLFGDADGNARELVTASPAATLEFAFDLIDDTYGSTERMLARHGVDDEVLDRLRTRLLAA